MHTALVIAAGLVLLGLALLVGHWLGGTVPLVCQVFIGVWLVAALINMWFGVNRAGYPVLEELPMLLVVFGIPAILAVWIWFKA
ncbi:hypothetical protein [Silvimonas iriomotensis]|uniref:Uncharacterized protein n=1 Tax=Silvimonas iriomotensis TaxID=449662 RepID=A0ABQ2P3R1_9NEIS|nr:hypothetical protein [Silvimonas iriomotensis]GGP17597.1 hypothetical protein GCM10010970_00530 [Silvimonas iriomotensis]